MPDKSEIEFVHLNGKSISKICTARGVKIDGQFLKDSTRTVIYVRPKKNYSSSDSSDSDSSDSDKLNDPIFLPKKTAAGSSKRKVSRSDDCVSVPKKLRAHGSKPQVNTPSTQEPGILFRDGRYYWVDEDGHEHLLDDNTSTDVQEITKNNIAEGNVNTQKSFQQSLRDYQSRISPTVLNIVVARSTALNELYSYLDDKEFSCLSNLSVRFKNEKGVGSGVKKELLSVLLQQLKASLLLEGNEFRKTFVSSRPAERNGEYFKMGQIISLVLLHGGPAPTFFSEIFWKLLIDEEITEVTLDDLLNETVRSQIMAVLQSGESSALINAVYVECDIFKAARTHEQIIGPDPVLKRDEAIKGHF
ncbi:unnamed protein product [Bemisia tabaci]|uniref:Uncharacterized protein n=1 Tax=Bemisia tabaci TaxID=7038 RepID=A0A9N9ZXC7_BEMTA|nr:unnamed protein product [Bemisia tabaci]